MTSSFCLRQIYRVNLFIKFFALNCAFIQRIHIYVGYQSGFSLINSVEYTTIHISLFCASRLEWKPLVEPVYHIILYCRSYFQFATLTLQLLLSVGWGRYICAHGILGQTVYFVMNNFRCLINCLFSYDSVNKKKNSRRNSVVHFSMISTGLREVTLSLRKYIFPFVFFFVLFLLIIFEELVVTNSIYF